MRCATASHLKRAAPHPDAAKSVVGPPHKGEVWSLSRRCDQTRASIAATRLSARSMRGWRAEKRKSYGAVSVAGHGRRLSARHTRDSACLLAATCGPAGPAFAIGAPPATLTPFPAPLHSALGKRLGRSDRRRLASSPKVVSQLLAGLLSEPGGSPAAARVPGCEPGPRGAAPRPALANASRWRPSVDEVCGVYGRFLGVGISLLRSRDSHHDHCTSSLVSVEFAIPRGWTVNGR